MYCHAIWYISSCLYVINIKLSANNFCIFVFLVDLSGKPSAMKNLVLACIWFLLCIDAFWVEFVKFSVIALLYHFQRFLLVVCNLWLYSPCWQSSNDGICQAHVVYLVPLFQCCCIYFSVLCRHLLTKTMGLNMLLFCAYSLEQLAISGFSRAAPSPTPDTCVSRDSGRDSS